ncbi:MAG: hypothetical protein OXN93_12175 [bacterium]|nr:hypothetical protein [bacterium]
MKSNDFREVEDGMKDIREQMDRMDGRLREAREEWRGIAAVVEGRAASRGRACANGASPKRYGTEPQPMKPYLKLAVLLLAAACSSDVITPDGAGPWWLEPANRAPEAVDEIPAQRLPGPGKAVAVAVGAHFTDPDGDTLTFAASSADTAVVAADVDGDTLRLAGGATGGAGTVTVTATDPSGLSASASVAVTVNRAPEAAGEAVPLQHAVAGGGTWTVAGDFSDPDGDTLTYTASSSDTAVVRVATSFGDGIELEAMGPGEAEVTMTATDPAGLAAATSFSVFVEPDPRPILAALYEATGGPGWERNENWLTDVPLGNWAGVNDTSGCSWTTGATPEEIAERCAKPVNGVSVRGLHLSNNALSGPIPPELGDLASLQDLFLGNNALTGPIPPELGNLASLDRLSLDHNALSGPIPPELGDLASLQDLFLGNNALTGPIPPELGNLASLERLWLGNSDFLNGVPTRGNNALSGPIPPELGNLASLQGLRLRGNALTGPIPPELGNLASLEWLDLADNELTGTIPPELGNLASLQGLFLDNNALTGPIPPELGNLASLDRLHLNGNPDLCAPPDPRLRAWLRERASGAYPCRSNPDARLLSLALMREDGNGLSLALPDDLHVPAVSVSDPGVVAATVADGWLELEPRSIGRADVELVPSGGGSPAVAGVVVREAVGTFGIDVVMEQPAPVGYEETMVAAADWWSYVLDGTEWEDRRPGCFDDEATALADELLIHAGIDADTEYAGYASSCFFPPSEEDSTTYEPAGGKLWISEYSTGNEYLARHEIGHILGLVKWPVRTGLTTQDRAHFTGPRAVEAYRAGGGDSGLPGVPLQEDGCRCHWHRELVFSELMGPWGGAPDMLSLAALADAGYTVDMTKATPWRAGGAAAAMDAEPFRERVEVRIVPRPDPEPRR